MIFALIPAIVAVLAVAVLGVKADARTREAPPAGPQLLTYGEARAAGVPTLPTPKELGLPMCHPAPNWHGFSSAEEAEKAVAQAKGAPECAADPAQAIYSTGGPVP